MGGSWDTSNLDCEPDKSKWLAKWNPEEMPHKSNSNHYEDATQWLSLSPLMCLSTCTILSLNTLLVSVLPVFMGILFCKARTLTLPTGLVARIWAFTAHDLNLFVGCQVPSPTSRCCKPRPPKINHTALALTLLVSIFSPASPHTPLFNQIHLFSRYQPQLS